MSEGKSPHRPSGQSDVHRAKRGKNLAVLAALVAFAVLVYLVALVRMGV